jgi:hypothetical protein
LLCAAERVTTSLPNNAARSVAVRDRESQPLRPPDLLRQHAGEKVVGSSGKNRNDNPDS